MLHGSLKCDDIWQDVTIVPLTLVLQPDSFCSPSICWTFPPRFWHAPSARHEEGFGNTAKPSVTDTEDISTCRCKGRLQNQGGKENDELYKSHYPTSTRPWHSMKPCSVSLSQIFLDIHRHLIMLFGPSNQIKLNQSNMSLMDQDSGCSRLQEPQHIIEICKAEARSHRR